MGVWKGLKLRFAFWEQGRVGNSNNNNNNNIFLVKLQILIGNVIK